MQVFAVSLDIPLACTSFLNNLENQLFKNIINYFQTAYFGGGGEQMMYSPHLFIIGGNCPLPPGSTPL